jgi:hypothetical protein
VYALFPDQHERVAGARFFEKAAINNLSQADLELFKTEDVISMHKGACAYADAVILGSETIDSGADFLAVAADKPVLQFSNEEQFAADSMEFFRKITEVEVS